MQSLPEVTHRTADLPNLRIHYVEAGEGPTVMLLHGFPEFWYSWRHQIPALVKAGYRVVAPDMRGYNQTEKPTPVAAYAPDNLADDIQALIEYLGTNLHALAGHDWGGGVAWFFAMKYPESYERLSILNCPHPARFLSSLLTLRQLRKSWYMFFFQLPWLPEQMIRSGDFAFIRKTLTRDPIRKDAFSDEDVDAYINALQTPGALTGAINYYRAAFRQSPFSTYKSFKPIEAPVQVLWGAQDRHLGKEIAAPHNRWVPNAQVEFCEDASHWLMMDRPEWVNNQLRTFLERS